MCKIKWITLILLLMGICGCAMHRVSAEEAAADANVRLGVAYLQQGNIEKARMALNQALSASPRSPLAWDAMAYLEELSGNLTAADQNYRYAIRLAPALGETHNNYGAFLCRRGHPQAGIQEFLFALQLQSYLTRAAAYQNAGRCALLIPDPKAAEAYFAAAKRNANRARNDREINI